MPTPTTGESRASPSPRYSEETGSFARGLPVRHCWLTADDQPDPICGLEVLSFRARCGAVAIAAEGIGGVETLPHFRRQGHIGTLLNRVLPGMAERVDLAFVSDGIESLYEKFGFVTALGEGHLIVPVRSVERMAASGADVSGAGTRAATPADLPAVTALYNAVHADRPGTHERPPGWDRLIPHETWRPGSEALVLARDDTILGYAVVVGRAFGDSVASLTVDEMAAVDLPAARRLLIDLSDRAWRLRVGEFRVNEPSDGVVGIATRETGCSYRQKNPGTGGMMARILNRARLVEALEPELRRRHSWPAPIEADDGRLEGQRRRDHGSFALPEAMLSGSLARSTYDAAFDALRDGRLLPDDRALVRLLLGHWSLREARAHGTTIPDRFRAVSETWFPGGGGPVLPTPYAHRLDRY
ncbi:MAG: GNAT family N-acetyltransferase [Frankia sp.]